jgi:hypothetical protein
MVLSYQIGFMDGAQDVGEDLFWHDRKLPKYSKELGTYHSEYHRGYVEGYLSIPWPQLQFFFIEDDYP